ncbi:GDP-6-deoxy-D-mannose reductase [Prochlorococcus marinus str. MIT 1342]|uniref:GDP-mannose 4,6-dehydratase n=1 Tax=Prochlorococcus TaxID=1218 RepID=UPI0007B3D060|nr:GDP-mannose 4,6-dehydratase [Prochlorococcus marinus]KZR79929.1 GDP-6-deoxy-D-mannose reductase [Prochlorococcus marinus str. MIT 1342]
MTKKALITGITGMVGSHLADYILEETNWDIVGMTRWRSPLENISHLVEKINNKDRVDLIYGDLRDSISIENAIAKSMPDYIFHLAAQSFPQTSFESPLDTLDTNIQGTTRVLEGARKHVPKATIHVCASSEVFGRVSREKLPIDEECTFHPASPYAISKVGTDLVGRFYAEAYNMKVMTTRMFTHTGPRRGDVFAESSFAKQIALAEAGFIKPIIKVGNLNSLRTIADVRDAVRAYYLLVTVNPVAGEYYNIGGTYSAEIGDILKFLIGLSTIKDKLSIEVDKSRLRPIDADLQLPNTDKFKNHTGWKPKISFEQTMTDLLSHWRWKISSYGNQYLMR